MEKEKIMRIQERINAVTGICLTEDKDLTVAITELAEKRNLSPEEYYNLLQHNNDAVVELATVFTVQETSFYRNKDHFSTLREHLLPSLFASQPSSLRILSAGCATGEEPYTIAMILHEFLGEKVYNYKIDIIALDISPEAISQAKTARYTEYKMKNIPTEYIKKYFEVEEVNTRKYYVLHPRIKNMVYFQTYNLLSQDDFLRKIGPFDIILCENVLIYFDHASIQRVINTFYDILKTPGFLFVGYSETLNTIEHQFCLRWHNHTYYYEKSSLENTAHSSSTCTEKTSTPSPILLSNTEYSYEDIYYHLCKAFLSQKNDVFLQWKDAFFYFFHRDPKFVADERIYLLLGEFHMDQNDIGNAQQMTEMAIEKNPHCIDALNLQAYVFSRIKEYQKARYTLQLARQISPDHPITLLLTYKIAEILQDNNLKQELQPILASLNTSNNKYKELFPYQPSRKIQFYAEINKILMEKKNGSKNNIL